MNSTLGMTWALTATVFLAGCTATEPLLDNPVLVRPDATHMQIDNPLFVPLGGKAYGAVFEKVIDILDDYFEISYANRYDGRIETFPRIAPGYEQFWKQGNPDSYDRLRATLQSMRNRAIVLIQPADDGGGYFVNVTVYKELEDLPRPERSTAGAASFQGVNLTVERQFEVIDPAVQCPQWIPQGHNCPLEQLILYRLRKCM